VSIFGVASSLAYLRPSAYINGRMTPNLTDQDRAEMAPILRDLIDIDRYPFSPKVPRVRELLAKVDP
jgi:hypothetical protein